jgi:hypothetical protein
MTRWIPLSLTTLIAVLGATAALALSGGHAMTAGAATQHDGHAMAMAMATAPSARAVDLRLGMRSLWEDHVYWTRMAVISLTGDLPDTKSTVARLLRNQSDIGSAIKPYYGAAASKKLTSLLRQHILIAADLIAAAKSGDKSATTHQQARWQANANDIAAFLNSANPRFWKLGALKGMLYEHLGLTTQEVVARLQHHWAADVRISDQINRQALEMADMLSSGIVDQFGSRFRS